MKVIKRIGAIAFLSVILIGVLIAVYGNRADEKHTISIDEMQNDAKFIRSDETDFYRRLNQGLPVNMLVVGDSIGDGTGSSSKDHAWPALVAGYLTDTYGSEVKLTNVSMGGCDSICGYVRVKTLFDDICYDLAVICYGENDKEEGFELYYESIIRSLRSKYPNIEIICIQESSQREYTYKIKKIAELADYYGYPVVDTIAPFSSSYDDLVVDGTHPNDDGYAIYAGEIEKTIDGFVDNHTIESRENLEKEPYCPEVTRLDEFYWIPKESFKKFENAYTVNVLGSIENSSIISVIDICDFEGYNRACVYNNAELVSQRYLNWPYKFVQRHIPILSTDSCIEEGVLRVTFLTKEQAESFMGIGFIVENNMGKSK